jgi:hypothetical protein
MDTLALHAKSHKLGIRETIFTVGRGMMRVGRRKNQETNVRVRYEPWQAVLLGILILDIIIAAHIKD